MKHSKWYLQIRLSTLLLVAFVIALVAINVSNRITIRRMQNQIDIFNQHLPEYGLAVKLRDLNAELAMAKEYYGDEHPIVRQLEIEIRNAEQRKKMEAAISKLKK